MKASHIFPSLLLFSPPPLWVLLLPLLLAVPGAKPHLGHAKEPASLLTLCAYTEKRRADFSKFHFVLIQIDIKMMKNGI